ncbi:hypothetical protein KLMA_20838 [Kluyveromyces marxianus DMKU3-1042]|uniref:Uncharacterized protein n=1 Tax=Kluyveromyces marxianus (strain DMKU3-1042 / BCC 29191 / NBRC 104275) TaxID=1003335 RepID=A0A1L7LMF1_KLUMD|nr:hypothetical protein KLMA_20838 [Kluyveromyces marxianus DMKU3-1042]BAQ55763.1 hypothetical protein KLMA_20838 [Kluyveromyces marxianus DMKU3-1042]
MFVSFYSCDVTFSFVFSACYSSFPDFSCPISYYGKSLCFMFLFLTSSLGNVSEYILGLFFVPHLSPGLSCPQFPMLPALHFSYTFTALTNLAPLAIKLHLTYTCNPHFPVLPGCHSQPYLSAPITCLPSHTILIFIFFFITLYGTNISPSPSSNSLSHSHC